MEFQDAEFDSCRKDSEQAASESGQPHLPIFAPGMRNVVFAAVASAFYGFTGKEIEVLTGKASDARVVEHPGNKSIEQHAPGDGRFAGRILPAPQQ